MVNYNNGKIYSLRTYNDDSLIYVGSTIQSLSKRHHGHKRDYNCYNGKERYITSFKIIECGDTYIELLETYPCNTKEELHTREGHWIRKLDCVNRCIAGRTQKQWRKENKDHLYKQRKQYREKNKDLICERKKKYNKDNQEYINDWHKQYREHNKDKLKVSKNKKYICVCGRQYSHSSKSRHMRTKMHNKLFLKVMEDRIQEMETDIFNESSTK